MQQTLPAKAKKSCRSWSEVPGDTLATRTTTCTKGCSHKDQRLNTAGDEACADKLSCQQWQDGWWHCPFK